MYGDKGVLGPAGSKTEELCDEIFQTNRFLKHNSKLSGDHGLDGVYIKKNTSGNVEEIIIN